MDGTTVLGRVDISVVLLIYTAQPDATKQDVLPWCNYQGRLPGTCSADGLVLWSCIEKDVGPIHDNHDGIRLQQGRLSFSVGY